ncbi:MAG: c-type cytochrome, partial [Planctomycetes bacterium]|nr:c-type cytochrome [Planctomycetota bacterium]
MVQRQITVMKVALLGSSLATLAVLGRAAYVENFRGEWRSTQVDYQAKLASSATTDAERRVAAGFPIGHKQLYLPARDSIDRCTTCHLGVENPRMANATGALRLHPGDLLQHHPPEKFGCTVCHSGRGRATTREAAHGWRKDGEPTPHIDTPMLRGEAVYTSCGRCHHELDLFGRQEDSPVASGSEGHARRERLPITGASLFRSLPGAHRLARGKRLVVELGCLGCHQYRGRGGVLGPDLTHVGDKTKHEFDFSHVQGEHTVEQWLYEHFMFPQEVSPGTEMPVLDLAPEEARALSLYMMGLHRKDAPASHLPRSKTTDLSPGAAVRGETLYQMFCSACHGAEGSGTTMREGLWPRNADPWGHDWDVRSIVVERRSEIDVVVPSLNHGDTLGVISDDYLRLIIKDGRPGTKMIAWSQK